MEKLVLTDFSRVSHLQNTYVYEDVKNELTERCQQFTTTNEDWRKYRRNSSLWVARSGAVIYSKEELPKVTVNGETVYKIKTYGDCLPQFMDADGLVFVVTPNRKTYHVHRLVAETFKPLPDNIESDDYDVHHIDNNSYHNSVDNLIWLDDDQHGRFKKDSVHFIGNTKTSTFLS